MKGKYSGSKRKKSINHYPVFTQFFRTIAAIDFIILLKQNSKSIWSIKFNSLCQPLQKKKKNILFNEWPLILTLITLCKRLKLRVVFRTFRDKWCNFHGWTSLTTFAQLTVINASNLTRLCRSSSSFYKKNEKKSIQKEPLIEAIYYRRVNGDNVWKLHQMFSFDLILKTGYMGYLVAFKTVIFGQALISSLIFSYNKLIVFR